MRKLNFAILLGAHFLSLLSFASSTPCQGVTDLFSGIECIKQNEKSFINSTNSDEEASYLENSAYRLINPELEIEYMNGNSLGDIQRDTQASLLFMFELGGKRKARAEALSADGLLIKADAFEQQIAALTDLGGALLRVYQLENEKTVIQESYDTFRKVIRLYRSRGQLPPEQKVSLHTFELVVLDYSRKQLEVEAELLRYRKRVELLFGPSVKGQPLNADRLSFDVKSLRDNLDNWLLRTPEMLRIRAEQLKASGEFAIAKADSWPDLRLGPTISQNTDGPFNNYSYGFKFAIQLPVLSVNSSLKKSRELTETRVASKSRWNEQDIKARYESNLAEAEKILSLLREAPTEKEIQSKHVTTEKLFEKGLVSGALMIEAHRSLVDHYETRHTLERELLESAIKLQHLNGKSWVKK